MGSDEELQARIVELEGRLADSDKDNDNLRAHIEVVESEKAGVEDEIEEAKEALANTNH